MRTLIILISALAVFAGCQSVKVAPVFEGQPAPFDGYNIGPEIYVRQGQPVKLSGMVIWIAGLDPNTME